MKNNLLTLIILLAVSQTANAQNLVPNGDFETFANCPTSFSQIYEAVPWMNPSVGGTTQPGSPDYYNQCAGSGVCGVPVNAGGYQLAHSGGAYSGIYLYIAPPTNEAREYLEAPLTSPLVANACYHFEMYVSLLDQACFNTPDIGVYFSDVAITGVPNYYPLPYTPQVTNPSTNVFDTLNWTLVSGNYTASGGETHIIIGNFNNDASTSLIPVGCTNIWLSSYVLVDDVSLSACTGINQSASPAPELVIYPNPAEDLVRVSGLTFKDYEKTEFLISDVEGRIILQQNISHQSSAVNIKSLKAGIYFIEINNSAAVFRKKFSKK